MSRRGRARGAVRDIVAGGLLLSLCVFLCAFLGAGHARAGDGSFQAVLASTPDGAYQAVYQIAGGVPPPEICGLVKVGPAAAAPAPRVVVAAKCESAPGELLPFAKWEWAQRSPEVSALRAFDPATAERLARIAVDDDTGVARLEIRRGGAWAVVRVIEGAAPSITGALETPAGDLVRTSFSESLSQWDEVWKFSTADLAGAAERRAAARQEAADATRRARAHRAQEAGIFAPPPAGTSKESWERRRRHGIATFVHEWEICSAYGPLQAGDVRDALWLLAWFDSPPRRYEALRWYTGLRERDPSGAAGVLADLQSDPDGRGLAAFLKSTRDHLRHLPDPTRQPITDEALRGLSDEDLHWVHRAVWALQAGYRFRDPGLAGYFALLPGYRPMSERRWQRLTSDPAWAKDPDAPLLRHDAGQAGNEALEAIRRAERARGLGPPSL